MLTKTNYSVSKELLEQAADQVLNIGKTAINEPTGRFFYDPWRIKQEFVGTVWDSILQTLPSNIGEARIIVLEYGACYQQHADIDDRYHLNLTGELCYLINLENNTMHECLADGSWYDMDAHYLHSAANFGRYDRMQLVVRHLLNDLHKPVKVRISFDDHDINDARNIFDNHVSGWLNTADKQQLLGDFEYNTRQVSFTIEPQQVDNLTAILPKLFKLEIL